MRKVVWTLIAMLLVLVACSPTQDAALPTLAILPTLAPTDTLAPTETPAPSETPTPTASFTASPTLTETSVFTPTPTVTSSPTLSVPTLAATAAAQDAPPGVIVIPAGTQATPRFIAQTLPEPVSYVEVLVAAQPIPIGIVLLPDQFSSLQMPEALLPEGTLRETSAALGLISRVNIGCGEVLQAAWLTEEVEDMTTQTLDWPPQPCPPGGLGPLSSPLPVAEVLVAQRDIPAGTSLSAEDLRSMPWPAAWIAPGHVLDLSEALGRNSSGDILAGQLLMAPMLLPR